MTGLRIFAGRSNPKLSEQIAQYLGYPLGRVQLDDFPRFENHYMHSTQIGPWRDPGLAPAVQRFGRPAPLEFGGRSYVIHHELTRLSLMHDLDLPQRGFNEQEIDLTQVRAAALPNPLRQELQVFRNGLRPATFKKRSG